MSQKKRKKYTPPPAKQTGKDPQRLQQTAKTKKMNPLARNLLLVDLICLCASQWLLQQEMIPDPVASLVAILGIIMLFVALYLEFGSNHPGLKGPKR